jgi:HK97 family phage major capsid protein
MTSRPWRCAAARPETVARSRCPRPGGVVGDSIVRDLARKIDAAYFDPTPDTNAPSGVGALAGVTAISGGTVAGGWVDFDFVEEARAAAENANAVLTALVCNPATAVKLSTIKTYTSAQSNQALLQPDPTRPASRVIGGVPLYTTPSLGNDIVFSIAQAHSVVARRQDVSLVTDASAYFSSDRVGIRATLRIGFAFTYPAAISKITLT